jgi:outer membrane immunogenic protein
MKKLLVAGIAVAAFCGAPAVAADMLVKAPVNKAPVAAPAYSWTGFYVGAELGGKWSSTTWTTTSVFDNVPVIVDASSPRNYNPSSVRVGGYLGYNWEFATRWIVGAEFDLAYANKTVTAAGIPGCSINCGFGALGTGVDSASVKLGWDASARARLGYLVTPGILIYGTGGVAWQNVQTSITCQHSVGDIFCTAVAGSPFSTATNSTTLTGWTAGGGLDVQIYANWILRGEYRYSYFGAWNNSLNLSVPGDVPIVGYQLKVSTQIATLGLGYKF